MTKKQKIKSVIISLIVIANDNQLVKKSIYIKIEKLQKKSSTIRLKSHRLSVNQNKNKQQQKSPKKHK